MKIKINVTAEQVIPSPHAVASAFIEELSGSWTVDETDYEGVGAEIVTDLPDEGATTTTVEFTIEVEVERITGKFISKEDLADEIISEIDNINFDVDGVEYTVVEAAFE